MVYFENGVVADIVFNPHSLVTRRTTATLLEGLVTHLAINE
jgi:DNA-directed RNA polymerase beta subunit